MPKAISGIYEPKAKRAHDEGNKKRTSQRPPITTCALQLTLRPSLSVRVPKGIVLDRKA